MNDFDPAWGDRFAGELGRLLPWLTADSAMTAATETYLDASDLDPREAAQIYAEELPPLEAGAPE